MQLTWALLLAAAGLGSVMGELVYCSDGIPQSQVCDMSGFASNYPNYVPRRPKKYHRCGVPGSLQKPDPHGMSCFTPQVTDCITLCKANNPFCTTFSYNGDTGECIQYSKNLLAQGFKRDSSSDIMFYSNACFTLGNPSTRNAPTATCAPQCTPRHKTLVSDYGEFTDLTFTSDQSLDYQYQQPSGQQGYSAVLDVSMNDQTTTGSPYATLQASKQLQGIIPGNFYSITFGSGYQTDDTSYTQAPNLVVAFDNNVIFNHNVCGFDEDINNDPGTACSPDNQGEINFGGYSSQAASQTATVYWQYQFLPNRPDSWQGLLAGLQVDGNICPSGTQYNGFIYQYSN